MTVHDQQLRSRRNFLQTGLATLCVAGLSATRSQATATAEAKMFKTLGTGHIGVKAGQVQALESAIRFGFGGVNVHADDLEKMTGDQRKELIARMKEHRVQWGVSGLPVQFRTTDEDFKRTIAALPSRAKVLAEVGAIRICTWILPGHDSLTYRQNFERHRSRLAEVAAILKNEGLVLGLEFVGPKSSRDRSRFHFVHTLEEQLELNQAIGSDNVGVLLDSYHWFTSGGSVADIEKLTGRQVIEVHVNDARVGIPVDQLPDGKRALPCSTGVIDLKGFMTALAKIGYEGPVTCEPFDQELNELDDETAIKKTAEALDRVFALLPS
ncbi:MAG: sugar phosphate isomerase/epimerase [Acidobacteria bacterium]|nr:MAG: sugar phosphate isomerase/epimerase [Acidobacteriota bacterium]